jgi:hypothetical protein
MIRMTRLKLEPVPRSTATTAYGLLGDVIEAIRQEPARLDMSDWITHFHEKSIAVPEEGGPACGTVACIAGWAVILARRGERTLPQNWIGGVQGAAPRADVSRGGGGAGAGGARVGRGA